MRTEQTEQKNFSPFAGGWSVFNNQCKRITWDEFMLMIDNEEHRERCARIAAGEKDLKILSPYFTPHAEDFIDGRRSNKSAVPSGCVMLDVDHQDPDEIWARLEDKVAQGVFSSVEELLSDQGIILCAKSVSGTGFRAIGRLASGETIIEGINRLAAFFGVEADTACKDLARASFLMPRSYIYYLDKEAQQPEIATKNEEQRTKNKERRTKNESPSASETSGSSSFSEAQRNGSSSFSEAQRNGSSSTISPIITRWLNQNGGTPAVGRRNNTLFQLALDFRYITDFDEAWLFRELPHFDLSDEEVGSVIHSAVKEERLRGLPKRLQSAVSIATENEEAISQTNFIKDITHRDLPPLPRLPHSLELLLKSAPEAFRGAILIAMLPALGTLATGLRFRYLDGQVHSPSFFAAVVAPSGTGKSFVRMPLDIVLKPILEQDEIAREQENEYKLARQKMKNSKEQPNDPRVAIRCHPLNVTIANLIRHMKKCRRKAFVFVWRRD